MKPAVVIGGGPAGLMAAETLRSHGLEVDLFEQKGSVGRKFLIAGKGGLNLTHGEPRPAFDARYRDAAGRIGPWLDKFDASALREWALQLGVPTYVGSSGRIFPEDRKAAPLLRGWVRRLKQQGVRMHVHHRWLGWDAQGSLLFEGPEGPRSVQPSAVVLAMGGGSWAKLGSDGAWVRTLRDAGIAVNPLQPANCGFDVEWTAHLRDRFAGTPLKPVTASWLDASGTRHHRQGECVITEYGIEGSLVYAASADLRDACAAHGYAELTLDLAPHLQHITLLERLNHDHTRSLSERLRRRLKLPPVHIALLYEILSPEARQDDKTVVQHIKALTLRLERPRPIDEAISSAGGVPFAALDAHLMLVNHPSVFCAGEMIDWEAPTGGYLLQACMASGRVAGAGAAQWMLQTPSRV